MQGHSSQYYQPLGNVFIDFDDNSEISEYHRELNLNNAIASVEYKRGPTKYSHNIWLLLPTA